MKKNKITLKPITIEIDGQTVEVIIGGLFLIYMFGWMNGKKINV